MLIPREQEDGGISLLVDSKQVDDAGDASTSLISLSKDEAFTLRVWLDGRPQPREVIVTQT